MKPSTILLALSAASVMELVFAYPGMDATIKSIEERARERRAVPAKVKKGSIGGLLGGILGTVTNIVTGNTNNNANTNANANAADPAVDPALADDGSIPGVLIGDIKDGGSTDVGKLIAGILLEQQPGQSTDSGYIPPAFLGKPACKKDTCCNWYWASQTISAAFTGRTGRCNSLARAAIRLGFHDAGTWSQNLASQGSDFGGADGSIVLAPEEILRKENKGLEQIVSQMKVWSSTFGVGVADLIQFSAAVAVVTCPLGPRLRVFVGRKDSSTPAPNGLLPGVTDSADSLINLFQDKTITPHMLTALLGAHTTSKQFFVDPSKAGAPQDGTPGVWDTLFYNQTLGLGPLPKQVYRFPSDIVLSTDSRTADEWKAFSIKGGQSHWNEDYAYSYVRLSLLGVNNINNLTECSKVLPAAKTSFRGAGELLTSE